MNREEVNEQFDVLPGAHIFRSQSRCRSDVDDFIPVNSSSGAHIGIHM